MALIEDLMRTAMAEKARDTPFQTSVTAKDGTRGPTQDRPAPLMPFFSELLEDRRIFKRAHIAANLLARRELRQKAPHDLSAARLRQRLSKADLFGTCEAPDLLRDMIRELGRDLGASLKALFERDEGDETLALQLIRTPDRRRLGHIRVSDKAALDLGRAETMPRDIEHIVDTAHHPIKAVLIASRTIARKIFAGEDIEIGLFEALIVAPDGAEHRRPGLLDDEQAARAGGDLFAALIDDLRHDAEEGMATSAGLYRCRARDRREHDGARFGLPPSIDDRTAPAPDGRVIPHPGLGVDRLADASEEPEAREIMRLRVLISPANERANRRRGGIEDRHLMALDDIPEARLVGVVRRALVHHHRRGVREHPIDDIAMTRHPADIGGAPIKIVVFQVKDIMRAQFDAEEISGRGMEHALRLPRRARGIQDEERMLGVDDLWLAFGGLRGEGLCPIEIAPLDPINLLSGALKDDDVLDARNALEGSIDLRFQRDRLAASMKSVLRKDEARVRVV